MKIISNAATNYQPRFANAGGEIMTTPDAIRQLRRDMGNLSRVQLANRLECSPLTVRNWEQGQSSPGPEMLGRIDALLNRNAHPDRTADQGCSVEGIVVDPLDHMRDCKTCTSPNECLGWGYCIDSHNAEASGPGDKAGFATTDGCHKIQEKKS